MQYIYIYVRMFYENIMRVNTNGHETWIEFYWIMVYYGNTLTLII